MNKFLFNLLAKLIKKAQQLELARLGQEFSIEIREREIEQSVQRARTDRYRSESLTEIDNALIAKRLELSNIKKSIELQETQADRRIAQINTEIQCEKTINFNLKAHIEILNNIITNLTKQLGNKVEIIK